MVLVAMVVGNFKERPRTALAAAKLGFRVIAVGPGNREMRERFAAAGIDAANVVRGRNRVVENAIGRLGGVDVLWIDGASWSAEGGAIYAEELQNSALDGRRPCPLVTSLSGLKEFAARRARRA